MAAAQDIECGYCCQKSDTIVDPRVFPCGHTHCLQCITAHHRENELITCGVETCGRVYQMSPDSMSPYAVNPARLCDTCVKKGLPKRPAVSYCKNCARKFCKAHLEQHDGLLDDHQKIPIDQFVAQETQPEPETCTRHENQLFTLGCKTCHAICCMKCLADPTKCTKGASHDFLALEDLAATLLVDDITAESSVRDEEYEELFKRVTMQQSAYEAETAAMLELIHQTRDSQLKAVELKYDALEKDVLENRQQSQSKVADFIEDVLLRQWNSLRNHREFLETTAKSSPPAAIVRGFKELKEQLSRITEERLPRLELGSQLGLQEIGERREIELKIISSGEITFGMQRVPRIQPESLTKLSTVALPSWPLSICHHEGTSYVGLYNKTVSKVDSRHNVTNKFISTSGPVESVTCYKDRLYTLSFSDPRTVGVYNMSGGQITSWKHPYHGGWSDMLVVIDDKVIIADPPNHRITTYSLNGQTLHHTPCPPLTDTNISMCACDSTSLIVSSRHPSKVFKVDMTSQQVVWTFTDVKEPLGLVSYGEYVLLAARNNKSINIINTTTGNIVSLMADDDIVGDAVFSLEVADSVLMVPKYNSRQLLFYKME